MFTVLLMPVSEFVPVP